MQGDAAKIGEENAELRADLAGYEERRRAEKAAQARLENQVHEIHARRLNIATEMERLGVDRAHLLSNNIELDQHAAVLSEQIASLEEVVAQLSEREAVSRAR